MTQGEAIYFKRFLKVKYRTPQFYITAKLHKSPWKTRPIVSTSGSIMAYLSRWVDYNINQIARKCPTYIKNSLQVKNELESIGKLPQNAVIMSADAVSMYTMIDAEHGLEILTKYLREFGPDLFNSDATIEALGMVMRNNILQFGDCYFEQLSGTAMGTPVACAYATLYYAYHERTVLLPQFKDHLLYLKRFIDDALVILLLDPNKPMLLETFKAAWPFGKLDWTFEPANPNINFLDLTIFRDESDSLITKTFEKPLNLHLYIPSHSAHPPGVLHGMIFGNLWRFKNQNSRRSDYLAVAKRFYSHLLARGYSEDKIKPIFLKAARIFEEKLLKQKVNHREQQRCNEFELRKERKERIFLHFQYHPKDVSRQRIQTLFHNTCLSTKNEHSLQCLQDSSPPEGYGGTLTIKRATVAYSRAPNIRDKVSPSTLFQPPGLNVSDVIKDHM